MTGISRIIGAAGALILPDDPDDPVDEQNRFRVHQTIRDLTGDVGTVERYVLAIYEVESVASPIPKSPKFANCANVADLSRSTKEFAETVVASIGRKRANGGLIIAFVAELQHNERAHGVLKIDFETDARNHIDLTGGTWSLKEVEDVLPTPRADVAKYAIVPQPGRTDGAAVRDTTTREKDPAIYWLDALDVTRERSSGTLAAIANAAVSSGYDATAVADGLRRIGAGEAVSDVLTREFPRIPASKVERLIDARGRRPRMHIPVGDGVKRTWTSAGAASITVSDPDAAVTISADGRTVTVQLSETSPPFARPKFGEATVTRG